MDLNPVFTDALGFRPQMREDLGGGEGLDLFSHAKISLVHGWLVDPSSPEFEAVQRAVDYDTSVNVVAEADHLAQGRLVVDEDEAGGSSSGAGSSSHAGKQNDDWSAEERIKIEDGAPSLLSKCVAPLTHADLKPSPFVSSSTRHNPN